MDEQPLDLKTTYKAIGRYRLLVAVLVVFGLGAGAAYGVRTPPMPEARSLVLLPPSAITGNPGASPYTQTQEIIATSTPVLAAAGSSVSPPLDPADLEKYVTVTAPSQDVLQIAVRAPALATAERLADSIATNYIAFVGKSANGSEQLLARLQHEAARLTGQILGLQHQIDATQSRLATERATSPAGERDSALLGALRTEQEQLSIELNNVNTQIVNAQVTTAQATSATQLLQSAEPLVSNKARVPLVTLLGALAGLAAGCVLAVSLARRDHRLRSRDAIAGAIGVPVVASMWAKRCKKVGDWRRLLERCKDPSPLEAWNARRVLQLPVAAADSPKVELRLLSLGDDGASAAAAASIAGAAVALGMDVRLEVGVHPALTELRAACVVSQGPALVPRGPAPGTATLDLEAGSNAAREFSGLSATVRLETADLAKPQVSPSFATTILVVSSGFATASDLAKVALAASDAGSPLAGVVVTNPEPGDHSAGLAPASGRPVLQARNVPDSPFAPELARRELQ